MYYGRVLKSSYKLLANLTLLRCPPLLTKCISRRGGYRLPLLVHYLFRSQYELRAASWFSFSSRLKERACGQHQKRVNVKAALWHDWNTFKIIILFNLTKDKHNYKAVGARRFQSDFFLIWAEIFGKFAVHLKVRFSFTNNYLSIQIWWPSEVTLLLFKKFSECNPDNMFFCNM